MTETDVRRSARLYRGTLVVQVVTYRDYIPNCSEILSSFGPPPARTQVGPVASRASGRSVQRQVESAARSRPCAAYGGSEWVPQPAASVAPQPAHGPGPDGSQCRWWSVAEYRDGPVAEVVSRRAHWRTSSECADASESRLSCTAHHDGLSRSQIA
jgi:hypothetical protein